MRKIKSMAAVLAFFFILTRVGAAPVEIRVQNSTGYEITRLYIAPASWTDWGEDFLGGKIIPDGEAFTVRLSAEIQGECAFDVRAIDADEDEYAKYNVDLCRDAVVVLTFDDYVEPEAVEDETDSYDKGYNAGYEEGFKAGKLEGFKEGYGQGFKDGFKDGSGKVR